ncbi:MAG: hypothetical protein AB7V58_13310 [Solirubrobacterales bacterium]
MLLLDLGRIKQVSDTLGHGSGDKVNQAERRAPRPSPAPRRRARSGRRRRVRDLLAEGNERAIEPLGGNLLCRCAGAGT